MGIGQSFRSRIGGLHGLYRAERVSPVEAVEAALERANSNTGRNVYLALDKDWAIAEAAGLKPSEMDSKPLWGVPAALKDCFDLEGFITTCGSRTLMEQRQAAEKDSAVAARLKACGAVIVGKTHMHQLAYGVTGENADFGDCAQPGNARALTGGSSSGAAASVLEGSAIAAIGTDTGGSIRVPAALCGLCGYRASWTLGAGLWEGGEHLAESFDTLGWLYGEAADGPVLGAALFGLPIVDANVKGIRVGVPSEDFLHDCEMEVIGTLQQWIRRLRELGAVVERFDAEIWNGAFDIFAPIQASEAARLHPEPRDGFEKGIAERLRWGASIGEAELVEQRERLAEFRTRSEQALAGFDFVLTPCTPVTELRIGDDQSGTRARILRYTTPASLLGWPAVTLPGGKGAPTLVGKMGDDARLLAMSKAVAS